MLPLLFEVTDMFPVLILQGTRGRDFVQAYAADRGYRLVDAGNDLAAALGGRGLEPTSLFYPR